jgi:hypothetical protein
MQVAGAEAYAAIEERYLARASEAIAGRRVACVLADRSPPPQARGEVLGGWWLAPEAPPPLLVLPNPWDDREAVGVAADHVWSLVEATTQRIAAAVVSPSLDAEEWHLLLGPWLVHAASGVLDRLLFVRAARAVAPAAPVLAAPRLEIPATMGEAVETLRTDAGNRALVGALAATQGLTVEPFASADPAHAPPRGRREPRVIARYAPRALEAAVLSCVRRAPTTLVGLDPLRPGDALRLAARGGGLWLAPPWRRATVPAPPAADPRARSSLGVASSDPIAAALGALLPRMLPRSVLEGYAATIAASLRRYGPPRHVVVNNYAADEVQNAFLVACRRAGRTLTFAQHGGFYSQARVGPQDWLEHRGGAAFLSWGSTQGSDLPAPSPRLAGMLDRHRGGTAIVLVEGTQPPDAYVIRFASHPLGNQMHEHDRQLAALVRQVSAQTRSRVVLKRFPSRRPPRRAPELAALPHAGPVASDRAVAWMQHAAVAVVTYPDTPFIEAMLLGVPTVGLWPARWYELREDAREPFDRLARARITFDDPAAAAEHLDRIAADPGAWWTEPDVRAARQAFLTRFAAVGPRPLTPWLRYLRSLRGAS